MPDFFTSPTVQAAVAVLILCVLIGAGFYLVSIFRDYAAGDQEITTDVLANLEEMHRKGDISDEEFRTIKSRTHRPPIGPNPMDDSPPEGDSSPDSQT